MPPFAQYHQRAKNVIHAIQALAIFVAWAITIAILTRGGKLDGRVWYYFALCWSCIPALTYQTACPVFQRIRRFSNAYVHAAIDITYTIFWLAAFACLIAWVKEGSHSAKDWKSEDTLCNKFAWGPVSKCKLGRASWIIGIIICLLFAITATFSIYGVLYYRKNGFSPQYSVKDSEQLPIEDHDSLADPSDKLRDPENMQLHHPDEDETNFTHNSAGVQIHPNGPVTWNLQQPHTVPAELGLEPDTSYHGGGNPYEIAQRAHSPPYLQYSASNSPYDTGRSNGSYSVGGLPTQNGGRPSRQNLALEYDHGGYAHGGRVDFPEADYGR